MTYTKTGVACGTCSVCGQELCRERPATVAYCQCWKTCPLCGTRMVPYNPDLTPNVYESGELDVVMRCPKCRYKSKQMPVEVELE